MFSRFNNKTRKEMRYKKGAERTHPIRALFSSNTLGHGAGKSSDSNERRF